MSNPRSQEDKPRLTKEQIDTIIYLNALLPPLTNAQIIAHMEAMHGLTVDEDQIRRVRKKYKARIDELKQEEPKALKQALELGDLPYVSVLHRVRKLSEVAEMSIDGYTETVAHPKGQGVVALTKRHPSAAVAAIRSITELVDRYQELAAPELPFTLNIGLAKPNPVGDETEDE